MQQETNHTISSSDDRKLSPKELRSLRRHGVKARRRRKRIICLLLAVVLIAVAAMPVYKKVYLPWQAKTLYNTTKNLYGQTGSGKLNKEYNEYFGALYDMNADVYGWLIISGDNTNENGVDLHLPVVQPKAHDESFYQTHLFNGKKNPYGTPYFAGLCDSQQAAYHTVIRGGHLLMGDLAGYRNLDFYKNAPTIFMDTLTDTAFYKIVAVVDVPDTEAGRFVGGAFATDYDYYSFVTEMGNRSLLYTGVTVNKEDALLTVLCDTGADNLAIIARGVREDESPNVDTSKAYAKQAGMSQTITDWVATPTEATATDVTATDVYETVTQPPETEVVEQVWEETQEIESEKNKETEQA